jgi:NitT/TauT family transport system substrate-binding protein
MQRPLGLGIFCLMIFSAILLNSIFGGGVCLAQTGLSARAKAELTKLSIGIPVPSISFLPAWVADQKGFLKEEGITDVKVLAFRGDADVVQALAAGTVDFNIASLTGLVTTISSGQKFRAVSAGYNMPYFDWYARPKFKSIADTRGGRYSVSKYGSLTDSLTRYALRSAGLDPDKDVKILQLGSQTQGLAAMEAGQIDALCLPVPQSYIAAEKGFVKLMSQKEQIAPDWPTHVVYGKEEFIAKNPNTVKALLRATARAMEWIKTHRDEAAQLASKQLKFKVDHCRKAIDEIHDEWHPDGRLPGKGLKIFWEISVEAGDVKDPWPNDRWLDDTFLKTQDQWRK